MAENKGETPSSSPPSKNSTPSSLRRRCARLDYRFLYRFPFGMVNVLLLLVYFVGIFTYAFLPSFFGEFIVSTHIMVAFFLRALLLLCYLTRTQSMGFGYFTVITEYALGYFGVITGVICIPFMIKEIIMDSGANHILSIFITISIVLGVFGSIFHIVYIKKATKTRSMIFLFNTGSTLMTKKEYRQSQEPTVSPV